MTIKYIIVDDEPLAHDVIRKYCDMLPHFEFAASCHDALEAMQCLHSSTIDLMFLDLNMPKIKGFDFLRTLASPPKVIITTAYKEYALEGYELDIVDYLVKPISFDRFMQGVNKAFDQKQPLVTPMPAADTGKEMFFVKGDKKHHQVSLKDILYIEAYGNYSKLVLDDGVIISHEKISAFTAMLPQSDFMRVHKSYIVALKQITLIEGNRIRIGENSIPIGQTYRSEVSKLYS